MVIVLYGMYVCLPLARMRLMHVHIEIIKMGHWVLLMYDIYIYIYSVSRTTYIGIVSCCWYVSVGHFTSHIGLG